MMLFAILLNIAYTIAAVFKEVKDVSISSKEIILEVEVPSLLTCVHKCLRHNAEVNFEPPICRCIIYKNETMSIDGKSMDDTTALSGLFYKRAVITKSYIKVINGEEDRSCKEAACSGKIRLVNPSQSSTLSSDWPASRALDEKLQRNGDPLGGCSHTDLINDQNPWWKAELVQTSYITKIKIMPRTECCKTYKHVTIATSLDDATWILCSDLGDKLNKASNWVETTCSQDTIARYVKVVQHNYEGQRMVLCEIEVFGHAYPI